MESPKFKLNINSDKLLIPKLRAPTFSPESCKITSVKRKSSFENSPRRKTPRTPRTPQEIDSPSNSLPGTPRSDSPSFSGLKFHLLKRRTVDSPRRTPKTPNSTPPRTPRSDRKLIGIHKVMDSLSRLDIMEENHIEFEDSIEEEEEELVKCTDAALIRKYLKICSKVRDNLFLGSDMIARDKETLLSNGITHVLNCAKITCEEYFKDNFKYKSMNLYDGGNQGMIGLFFEAVYFIEQAISNGGKVYVHCVQGISRSSTFVLSYLIWKEKIGFKKLYENLKTIRPVSSPNPGFLVQLMKWEDYLKKRGSILFRISPLNSYYGRSHFQVGPLLCESSILDSRTNFILINENLKIFLWKGKKSNEYTFIDEESKYFIKTIQHGLGMCEFEFEIINESFETKEFQSSLLELKINFSSNTNNDIYPELIFLEKSKDYEKFKKQEKEEEIKIPKIKAKLFNFDDDYFDDYGIFDKDDLDSDGVFILLIDELNLIYIWKGELSEYEDDLLKLGKQFLEEKNKNEFYIMKIINENEEPDEFWNYF
eukprot:gene5123-8721_t